MLQAGMLRLMLTGAPELSATRLPWAELRADLRRFVAARVAAADVDDVVQDALVRIHRGVAGVRDAERLGGWIYQVARSAIVDRHRRSRPVASLDEVAEAPTPTATDDASFARLAACLTPFVAMLRPAYRQAITMVELEGVAQVEAARRLGVPLSTLKARVQRGRAQLRELLEACCAIGVDARGHVIDVTSRVARCAC